MYTAVSTPCWFFRHGEGRGIVRESFPISHSDFLEMESDLEQKVWERTFYMFVNSIQVHSLYQIMLYNAHMSFITTNVPFEKRTWNIRPRDKSRQIGDKIVKRWRHLERAQLSVTTLENNYTLYTRRIPSANCTCWLETTRPWCFCEAASLPSTSRYIA